MILNRLLLGVGLVIVMIISDGIELFTNHQLWDTAYNGLLCSWSMIPLSLILPVSKNVYYFLYVLNILLPLVIRTHQDINLYVCYKWEFNILVLGMMVIINIIMFLRFVFLEKSTHYFL